MLSCPFRQETELLEAFTVKSLLIQLEKKKAVLNPNTLTHLEDASRPRRFNAGTSPGVVNAPCCENRLSYVLE